MSHPIPTESHVDVPRFMGNWYVQGHVAAPLEGDAHNAVESYALSEDGEILTTYAYRDGGFDGPLRTMKPTGTVHDEETGAEWRMRFFGIVPAEYLIAYVSEDYGETIVARSKRDFAWIMTREAEIDEERFARLVDRLASLGYDTRDVRRVPQSWPDPEHPAAKAGPKSLAEATRDAD